MPEISSALKNLPFNTRAVTWNYPSTVTLEQARSQAQMYASHDINLLICDGHRFLFSIADDPREFNDPFHFNLHPTVKSNDATENVVTAMKEHGIKVMHHTSAAYCPRLHMEKHPDWCQENMMAPGKPVFFGEYGGVHMFCLNNPNFRQAYFEKVLQLQNRMQFDAWMIDEVEWLPDWYSCGCKHCRQKFKDETGYDLPTDVDDMLWGDFSHPIWRSWISARMRWCGDFFHHLRAFLDKSGVSKDHLLLLSCHAGMSDTWSAQYWGIDVIDLTRGIDWVFYEAYVNQGAPFHSWRRFLAEVQTYSALARVRTCFPGLVLFYPKGDRAEASWCWAANFTLGQQSWFHFLNPQLTFARDYHFLQESPDDVFLPLELSWERNHQFLLYSHGTEIVDVALVFSKSCRDLLRTGKSCKYLDATDPNYNRGYINEWGAWAETLVANNIPHRIILDEQLCSVDLQGYKVVLLPATECLSILQIEALLQYATDGGKIVFSGKIGSKDETGATRQDNVLIEQLKSVAYMAVDSSLAETALRGYVRLGQPVKLPESERVSYLKSQLIDVIKEEEKSWSVCATEGVIIKVWTNKEQDRVKIVALNCLGADLASGTVLQSSYPVRFQSVPVKMTLRQIPVDNLNHAVCYYPSSDELKVIEIELAQNGDISLEFILAGSCTVIELKHSLQIGK